MTAYDDLEEHLRASNAAPFLFVGAGLARRYLNLDDWVDLLSYHPLEGTMRGSEALVDVGGALESTGVFVGRAHLPSGACPQGVGGPTPVAIRRDGIYDLSPYAGTVAHLLNRPDAVAIATSSGLTRLGSLSDVLAETHYSRRRADRLYLLAPIDLQVIKACGVTFADSLVERVIEEQAQGQPERADMARERLQAATGSRLVGLRAGTPEALNLLSELRAIGITSPYLEVGLGRYVEVFTKAPALSAVGTGSQVGVRRDSEWNNPEPEVVLAVNGSGAIVAATLGNDVNLRDFEGWSPLLLGVAKDNTGSCAIGPWLRLFDRGHTLEELMTTDVSLEVEGQDGFRTLGANRLSEISRDPRDLVEQASGLHHQYPDGFALFLGTMMVPSDDRMGDGRGFTHHVGDLVRIHNPLLGSLVNWVNKTDEVQPWTDGLCWLMDNLASRNLIGRSDGSSPVGTRTAPL